MTVWRGGFWVGWMGGGGGTCRAVSERVARPRGGTGRIRPRQARPSRVAPRYFTSEQFRWVGTRRVGAVPSRAGPLFSFHLPDPRFRVLPPLARGVRFCYHSHRQQENRASRGRGRFCFFAGRRERRHGAPSEARQN